MHIIKIFFFLCLVSFIHANEKITPSEVYSQVIQIKKEIDVLKKHFNINTSIKIHKMNSKLKPRHAWQKTYEIFIKINILRASYSMPKIEPANLQPVLNINPILTYEQTQRILTELRIFKTRLGINKQISHNKKFINKTPLDVYNTLNNISKELDLLNGTQFNPSYVFGETIRIYKDLTTILEHLNIKDTTIPTIRKNQAKPKDTFNVSMNILSKIKYIQLVAGIESIDFSSFKKETVTPSDVFGINEIILAELQTIKAHLGLKNYITPGAKIYFDKTPSDVEQMLGWCLRRVSLIKSLNPKQSEIL